jgi:hypothetical protein
LDWASRPPLLWERTKNRDVFMFDRLMHVAFLYPFPMPFGPAHGNGTSQILLPSGQVEVPQRKCLSLRPANGEETYRLDELNLAATECSWRIGIFVGKSPSFRKFLCSKWCPLQHVCQAFGGAWSLRNLYLVFVSFAGHLELGRPTHSFYNGSKCQPAFCGIVSE